METENRKKVLITGGSGFIGQYIASKFKKSKSEVCVYDSVESRSNNYVKGDIFDLEKLEKIVKKYDIIIHLVGLADGRVAQKEPIKSFKLNLVSLQNVLEACRISNENKRVIFPSSAAVYGVTEDLPIKENSPLNPNWIYSWHKYLCEKLLKAYHDNFGIDYTILRLFNVYGKGNKGVIEAFLEKARRGGVIESFGPYQYRDFIYAGDVADAFYEATFYEKATNRIINIGSGKGIQIKEILDLICEIFPKARWKYVDAKFTMYDSIADITLAKILLDFKPHTSKEFMKKVILEEML